MIINNGTLTLGTGSELDNYGTFVNNWDIDGGGTGIYEYINNYGYFINNIDGGIYLQLY